MGGDRAAEALRKALAMGAHKAVHISDDGLAGSCALQTSAALAAAIKPLGVDLVITGNESTDGARRGGELDARRATGLAAAHLGARPSRSTGGTARAERVNDGGYSEVSLRHCRPWSR